MQVRLSQEIRRDPICASTRCWGVAHRNGAASALWRALAVFVLALGLAGASCLVAAAPASAAGRHGKVHGAGKKPAKLRKTRSGAAQAARKNAPAEPAKPAVPPPVVAPPAAAAALSHPVALSTPAALAPPAASAVGLPAAPTPAAAALPHAAPPVHASAQPVAAPNVPKPKAAAVVRLPTAVALPLAATPVALARAVTPSTAVALPAVGTPVPASAAAPSRAAQPGAVGLAGAVTPSAAAGKSKTSGPVATAWALPQVPAEKLKSDVRFESIKRLVQAGQFNEALGEVNALLEKAPNDDELLAQRARLTYWLDRRESAREYLNPLLERHPDDPELRELDAQLRLAEGDKAGALAQYRALELAGDGRVELHQRIIDLSLDLDETEAVTKSLKFGGHLDDEQEMAYVRQVHPWFADVAGTATLHSGVAWWRADASLGRRINKRWSALVGGVFEQRYAGADRERAESIKGELYFGFSRIDGMLHLESSPSKTFLPVFDGRAELAVSIVKQFSLGVYGRFADYLAVLASHAPAAKAWTLAPNAILYLDAWTVQPGYMLMNLAGNTMTATTYFHTGFLKLRWEPTPRWMAFAWLYFGTDPTFVERFGIATPTGASVVLGGEHWWTPRWGTRVSMSRVQPFDSRNDPFTDFTVVLRGRL